MTRNKKFLSAFIAFLLAIVIGFAVRTSVSLAAVTPSGNGTGISTNGGGKLPDSMNRDCPNEGSYNCYWDAKKRANGKGHSFVVRQMPKQKLTCVMYNWSGWRNHDYCYKY